MRRLLTILLLFAAFHSKAQITDTATLGSDQYLINCNHCGPYERVWQVVVNQISTTGFKNIMNYGAAGDGTTADDAALKSCINAAIAANVGGIILPNGKTFLLSKLQTFSIPNNFIIYAYGATVKGANRTGYSFIQLNGAAGKRIIWMGGKFDGNQYNQVWPGNPHGGNYDSAFTESHGRFVGISNVAFGMFKDVIVINTVVDGPTIEDSKINVFDHDSASGGAPIWYDKVLEQGTYFKVRRNTYTSTKKWAYFLYLKGTGGSIGDHYSYPTNQPLDTNSTSVHVYCQYWNQKQDGIHIEDCYKNFFYRCSLGCDNNAFYQERLHLSNRSGVVSVVQCNFVNAYVNFNQASNLRLGIVSNCNFISTYTDNSLQFFAYNPTHIFSSTFDGKVSDEQAQCNNVKNSTFSNFGSKKAITSGFLIDTCTFKTGTTQPISFATINGVGGKGFGNNFISCPTNTNSTPTTGYLNTFKSKAYFKDDLNNFLGLITAGL